MTRPLLHQVDVDGSERHLLSAHGETVFEGSMGPLAAAERKASRGGRFAEGGPLPTRAYELADDVGIEGGAPACQPGQGIHELSDVGDAVFQQVADSRWVLSQQLSGVASLYVLGEHEHADPGVATAQGECGSKPRSASADAKKALARPGRYHLVAGNLSVKEVRVGERARAQRLGVRQICR